MTHRAGAPELALRVAAWALAALSSLTAGLVVYAYRADLAALDERARAAQACCDATRSRIDALPAALERLEKAVLEQSRETSSLQRDRDALGHTLSAIAARLEREHLAQSTTTSSDDGG